MTYTIISDFVLHIGRTWRLDLWAAAAAGALWTTLIVVVTRWATLLDADYKRRLEVDRAQMQLRNRQELRELRARNLKLEAERAKLMGALQQTAGLGDEIAKLAWRAL